jgi:hypothetical protein
MRKLLSASLLVLVGFSTSLFTDHQRGWAGDPAPESIKAPQRHLSAARLANALEVRKRLGLVPNYEDIAGVESIKIAILDYGFEGIGSGRPYLPEKAVVVEHYASDFVRRYHLGDPDYRKSFAPSNSHGRTMAQIVWAVTGFHDRGPKFYLLNANGPTMLRRAVRYAIEAKVDLILFCGTFEGGGNGDGRGPINRIVADALAADILWINAAGNYGGHVYNGAVHVLPDHYLRFGSGEDGTALRFKNLLDENTISITLTWNDYREEEDAGTDKDLDLYVEDSQGKQVGSAELVQVSHGKAPGPNESRNPRERVVLADLPASDQEYRIRIWAKSANFSSTDRIRVLIASTRESFFDPETNVAADAVRFLDATGKGEIYPPADNPLVLTVGDTGAGSANGPTEDHRVKPDVLLEDSRAFFTNGEVTAGASNAAAYFAGVVALLKAAEPGLRTRHLLWFAHHRSEPATPERASTPRETRLVRRLTRIQGALQATGMTREKIRPPVPTLASGDAGNPRYPSPPPPLEQRRSTSYKRPELQGQPSTQPRRVWRTPTRQELAERVRTD